MGYLDDVIFHTMMLHLIIWSLCYDGKNIERYIGDANILPWLLDQIDNFKLK
jgi:hypothetical protein